MILGIGCKRGLRAAGIVALLIIIVGIGAVGLWNEALAQESQVLVWQVGGVPGNPSGLGTLFWHSIGGSDPVNLSDVPNEGNGTRVFACGMDAVSPAGDYLVAYIGAQTQGGLYRVPLTDAGTLQRWGDTHALTCNGRGHAQFNRDGSRWAYLNFESDATGSSFPDGILRVLNSEDGSEAASFNNTITFALRGDNVYYAQFFTDANGLADEMVISVWDGTLSQELAAVPVDEDCDWRSARLAANPETDEIVVSAGQRCTGAALIGSIWRLFTLTADGASTERVFLQTGGAYLPTAYINQAYYLEDGTRLLATYPNGLAGNVANLVLVTPEDNSVTAIRTEVVVDAFPEGRSEHLLFAPDGSAVAFRTDTANGDQTLHLLRLDGGVEPVSISAGPRGDVISVYFFTPDSRQLVFVAGGANGSDNSLWTLAVGESEPRRVTRGLFQSGGGLAGDGVAYLLEHVPPDDNHRDSATNLVAISLDTGARAVVVNGRESEAWAYPLTWR